MRIECFTPQSAVKTPISGFTDPEGNFSIGTYQKGDGAPVGAYNLTFMWGQHSLFTGRYGGPDKLRGLYNDPEKSEVTVTVREGKPNNLGEIKLSLDDAPEPEELKRSFRIDSENGD